MVIRDQEFNPVYDRRDLSEARKDLAQWLDRRQKKYPKLCASAEENIGETFEALHQRKGSLEYHDARRYPISKERGSSLTEALNNLRLSAG